MDRADIALLRLLQRDAGLPMSRTAELAGLSKTACWRRIKQLEEAGVLKGTVALADRHKLGLTVVAFVSVKTANHSAGWTEKFAAVVRDMEEVVEFHRLAGDIDYLLKVVLRDISAYDDFYKRLVARIDLTDVTASFSMEEIKATSALPVPAQS